MKDIRKKVHCFMLNVDTCTLNTNEFVMDYYKYYWVRNIRKSTSMENVLRCRRYIIKTEGLWVRTNADTEISYIKKFALKCKYRLWM